MLIKGKSSQESTLSKRFWLIGSDRLREAYTLPLQNIGMISISILEELEVLSIISEES